MGANINTRKHVWYAPINKTFIMVVERTPKFQLLGILYLKKGREGETLVSRSYLHLEAISILYCLHLKIWTM